MSVSLQVNLADATYQLRATRFAETLLNGVVRSVEDWPKPSFHRAGHHASLMHMAAHRKNSGLAFNHLVALTECYARCRAPDTDAAVAALAKSHQAHRRRLNVNIVIEELCREFDASRGICTFLCPRENSSTGVSA